MKKTIVIVLKYISQSKKMFTVETWHSSDTIWYDTIHPVMMPIDSDQFSSPPLTTRFSLLRSSGPLFWEVFPAAAEFIEEVTSWLSMTRSFIPIITRCSSPNHVVPNHPTIDPVQFSRPFLLFFALISFWPSFIND